VSLRSEACQGKGVNIAGILRIARKKTWNALFTTPPLLHLNTESRGMRWQRTETTGLREHRRAGPSKRKGLLARHQLTRRKAQPGRRPAVLHAARVERRS
jgi:hypothetical protein